MEPQSNTHPHNGLAERPRVDTIEIELSKSDIQLLAQSESAPVSIPQPAPAGITQISGSLPHSQQRRWQLAFVAGMVISVTAFVAVGSGALRARPKNTDRTQIAASATVPVPPPQADIPPSQPDTVRFKNPFDSSEVFEFPAGTSDVDARQAVAEILVQRARERGIPSHLKSKNRR